MSGTRRRFTSIRVFSAFAALAVGLFAAGCPADDADDDNGNGQQMDTGPDAEPDTEIPDAAPDTAEDVAMDTEEDTQADTEPDTQPDTQPDMTSDPVMPGEGDLVITEAQPNPTVVSDSDGEYFELYNPSTSQTYELMGCRLKDEGTNDEEITSSIEVPPDTYFALAKSPQPGFAQDATFPSGFTLGNGGDEIILECDGTVVDKTDYNNYVPDDGYSTQLAPGSIDHIDNDDPANWCDSPMSAQYNASGDDIDYGTPGDQNEPCPMP